MNLLRRLLREDAPAHLTLANLIAFGLTFLAVPLISHTIGAAGRGETAAALSAFAIAPTLIGLGVPLELRRRAARDGFESSVRAARDMVLMSVLPAIALGVLFVVTIFAHGDDLLRLFALIGMAMAPLSVSWALDAAVLAGQGKYRAVAVLRITHPAINLLVIVGLLATGHLTEVGVLVASMSATLATATVGLLLCRVTLLGERARRRTLLRTGTTFAGSAIAESASSRLDQILVLPLIGATAAGQYSIAASLALLPLALGQALAAEPFRSAAAADTDQERRQITSRALRETFAVVIPACVVYVLIAAPLTPVVFGAEFAESVPVLFALLPGMIALTVAYVASMQMAAHGRGKAMTLLQILGLVVGTGLLLVLGPLWGAIGAGVASSVSYLVLLTGQLVVLGARVREIVPSLSSFTSGLASLLPRRPDGA